MQKNACWVFETVRIISIIIRLICFTEKVYGSNPYSPNIYVFFSILGWISYVSFSIVFFSLFSTCLQTRRSIAPQNRDKNITIGSFIENQRDRKRKKNFDQINRRKDRLPDLNFILLQIGYALSLPILSYNDCNDFLHFANSYFV